MKAGGKQTLKIGDKIKGEALDFPGYEFEITGGADYCGFPMRRDIEGPVRKKVLLVSGVGIRNKEKGIRKRKTVCGNTIHDNITQISMKILKHGKKPLVTAEEAPSEEAPAKKEKPAEKQKEEKPKKRKEEPEEKVPEAKEETKKQETKKEEKLVKEKAKEQSKEDKVKEAKEKVKEEKKEKKKD